MSMSNEELRKILADECEKQEIRDDYVRMIRNAKLPEERLPNFAIAALSAMRRVSEKASVPEGWKLVPVEPTQEMEVAALEDWLCVRAQEDRGTVIYKAMLSAAPLPPSQKGGE